MSANSKAFPQYSGSSRWYDRSRNELPIELRTAGATLPVVPGSAGALVSQSEFGAGLTTGAGPA